ncbi:MAG: DUF2085 domain-containing protein [Byssovorax sp.]
MDPRAPAPIARAPQRWALPTLAALLVAAGLFPWLIALRPEWSRAVFDVFRTVCHQRPERTLTILGAPMVVCSRCAGLYLGVAIGVPLPLPRRWLPYGRAMVMSAIGIAALDVLTQDLGLHAPFHPVRVATGLLLGWTACAFMMGTLRTGRSRSE